MNAKTGKIIQCLICKEPRYVPGKRLTTFRYCSYRCTGIAKRGIIPLRAFTKNDVRITGSSNYGWKGEKASYAAKHRWIKKWFGNPDHCEICNTTKNIKYNWANISGLYKRVKDDWRQMCIPCHRRYDKHGEKCRVTWYKNNSL